MRILAFVLYGLAAFVAGWLFIWSNNNPPESWEWLPRFLIGGPVLLLVWAAVYASRESSEHRNSSRLFQHQSLAFMSLDKYAARIARPTGTEDPTGESVPKAAGFLYDISKSLFTNQIDAHVEQIKAQGRAGRISLKRGTLEGLPALNDCGLLRQVADNVDASLEG